jgi:glutamate-1-semialdehyde aminotransferase
VPLDWLEDTWADDVAAVIVEAPPNDGGWDASRTWLHWLANTARINGALFVLDEVVTGFRYGPGGAAQYYEIEDKVDLYCFGKTIGNGFPIACLGGKAEIMNELCNGVHVSGTFFGFPMGLAAVKATMRELLENPPWEHLGFIGRYLKEQWNKTVLYKLIGHPTRPIIDDTTIDDKFTDLRRHLFRRGHIIVDHPFFVSTATTKKNVDDLVTAAKEWIG